MCAASVVTRGLLWFLVVPWSPLVFCGLPSSLVVSLGLSVPRGLPWPSTIVLCQLFLGSLVGITLFDFQGLDILSGYLVAAFRLYPLECMHLFMYLLQLDCSVVD